MPKKTRKTGKGDFGAGIIDLDAAFSLEQQERQSEAVPAKSNNIRKTVGKRSGASGEPDVLSYRHIDKRINNPDVGLVTPDTDRVAEPKEWRYDVHIDPALQFDMRRSQIEELIDDALASRDEGAMRAALEQLKRQAEPYLNWAGKAERTSFEVDTVSLHVHERIDPATILASVRKRMKGGKDEGKPHQEDWLRAWFEEPLPLREAIDFYRHERGWANRLITGDSLLVMNSLLQKESMAGHVQMIYIDPPYGIKYGSNFQPFVDRKPNQTIDKDEDLTQEPEMIKAFRDTWELGIHSYLTYLRDRLLLSKELLSDTGSVFVQISDDNLHFVRQLMDEVFGVDNFVSIIAFRTKIPLGTTYLSSTYDFLVWYSKNKQDVRYNKLFQSRATGSGTQFTNIELTNGNRRKLTDKELEDENLAISMGRPFRATDLVSTGLTDSCVFDFELDGKTYSPKSGKSWKTNPAGMEVLIRAGRILHGKTMPAYLFFSSDYPVQEFTNVWTDTQGASDKAYVVETSEKVIERCLLMTTMPGDLVLDPTCGGGTTALVAENWGRRWITCDTSRVAVTLAKQRLLTASYEYYELKYPHEGLKAGFIYRTVPHITLGAITNNPEISRIYEQLHPAIEQALAQLNAALKKQPSKEQFIVLDGSHKDEKLDFSKDAKLHEWEVPFNFPANWPASARAAFNAFRAARQAMQKKMDDSISAHADQETLYDQPLTSKDKLRISGPFTVEAVPFPSVLALEENGQPNEADITIARSGESGRQHSWRDELLKTGIRGKGGQMLKFTGLETLPDLRYIHASGTLVDSGERVVVSFGPEYAALEQRQVEMAMREASELFPRPKMIVFCAFTFDPEAAKNIDQTKGITALKVQMNTDLLTEDLKKARASNQSFWLMGQPDVEVRKTKDNKYQVEVHGFDYFDTVHGDLISGGKGKIAAWALDTDYDERSLFPRQVFFPMAGKKDGWEKLKKNIRAELDESLLDKLHGTVSLPFEAGENRKIAVKIVDDRGIESLKIINLD